MSEIDSRIKAAANDLARALTEGSKNYIVSVDGVEITKFEDQGQRFAYTVHVIEHSERRLAP